MRSSPVAKKSKPLEDISKDENVQSNNQKTKKKGNSKPLEDIRLQDSQPNLCTLILKSSGQLNQGNMVYLSLIKKSLDVNKLIFFTDK